MCADILLVAGTDGSPWVPLGRGAVTGDAAGSGERPPRNQAVAVSRRGVPPGTLAFHPKWIPWFLVDHWPRCTVPTVLEVALDWRSHTWPMLSSRASLSFRWRSLGM